MATLSPKNIAEAIYVATKGKSRNDLEGAIKRSVNILWKKRMFGKSKNVLEALQGIFERQDGIVRAKITTAEKMEEGVRKKIESEIKEKYKARGVVGEFYEKKEVLGGIRVEVGDEVMDATYLNRLRQLEKFLIQDK